MSYKSTKRTLLFVLVSFLFISVCSIGCNNEGDAKTESTKSDTVAPTVTQQDTVKRDTQRTRPVVKPN